ncbi:class I SAM-dependent methyltransferase [Shouchella shacheensis]|uniref:class I SAM-dependent methyltransferase n=1 Tax=Shouchella shacheensis TaxID=1649580 RepID=UPI00073FF825|nr:class I SAM-dependent methyltransferase [Shouchella shacheensis]
MSYTDMIAQYGIGSAHPGGFIKSKTLLHSLHLHSNSRVLDCGCGTGQTAAYVKKQFACKVDACDLHPVMLDKAKARFEKENLDIALLEARAENLPYEDDCFHLLLSESVTSFTSIEKSLNEYWRVLKPGGILCMNEIMAWTPLRPSEEQELRQAYGFSRLLGDTEWVKVLQASRFQEVTLDSSMSAAELQQDLEDKGGDMTPSEIIPPSHLAIMNQHQQLSVKYKDKIGHGLFLAKK